MKSFFHSFHERNSQPNYGRQWAEQWKSLQTVLTQNYSNHPGGDCFFLSHP